MRWLLFVCAAAVSVPAHAQLSGPVRNGETTITVTGARVREGTKVEMSDWRMAETPHVVVFSKNDEAELRQVAHNLEKLHFLLSALLGRVEEPDETIKIAVTMIGDAGDFDQLRLTDLRWQYGPFPKAFEQTIYYDPREEGPVLATTKSGVNIILNPSRGAPTTRDCSAAEDQNQPVTNFYVSPRVTPDGDLTYDLNQILSQLPINEVAVCQSAESRLYAGFVQNYLMTYFPAAYPRWFLQGFGEVFATMVTGEGYVEYGQLPPGFYKVRDHFPDYPVSYVLDGRYLTSKRDWTPYHAWRMVHLLYFSDEWKPKLQEFMTALADGADPLVAQQALGDPAELNRAVALYRGRRVPYERMDYPADRTPEPAVRRLTRAEAGLVRGRLELGARIELPDEGSGDVSRALARRAAWLERLRDNATRFPDLIENQQLLAEAECRSGNPEECLAAADRVLGRLPTDTAALVWKGTALTQLAARAPATERERRVKDARSFIVQANRINPDGILPLIAYYNSFDLAGEPAPDIAVDGLFEIVASSPAAPASRLKLGKELVARDLDLEARDTLLPVAKGPFDTPEQPAAAALLPTAEEAQNGG